MGRVDGKVALVTGGASGIGKGIAQRLAVEGARVVITDVQRELGRSVAAECGLTFLEQDVCDEARWIDVLREIETRFKCLDILVNNAGILGRMDAVNPENTPFAEWKRIFAANVESVFLACRATIPVMKRAGGGSIINISSTAAMKATPFATAYGASKAAVRHLTKSVAQYCAQQKLNIRCNSLHPGDVLTPAWMQFATESARLRGISVDQVVAEASAIVPLGRLTLPEEIAAAVLFLASNEAHHITGEKLVVDGGYVHCDTMFIRS